MSPTKRSRYERDTSSDVARTLPLVVGLIGMSFLLGFFVLPRLLPEKQDTKADPSPASVVSTASKQVTPPQNPQVTPPVKPANPVQGDKKAAEDTTPVVEPSDTDFDKPQQPRNLNADTQPPTTSTDDKRSDKTDQSQREDQGKTDKATNANRPDSKADTKSEAKPELKLEVKTEKPRRSKGRPVDSQSLDTPSNSVNSANSANSVNSANSNETGSAANEGGRRFRSQKPSSIDGDDSSTSRSTSNTDGKSRYHVRADETPDARSRYHVGADENPDTPPVLPAQRYIVTAGAYGSREVAEKIRLRVIDLSLDAVVVPVTLASGATVYRVQQGVYRTQARAKAVQKRLQDANLESDVFPETKKRE